MIVLALLSGAIAKEKAPVDKDVVFSTAVDQLQHENYLEAANAAWEFLQVSTTDDPRYDRGQRLLTQAAEGMGLEWAAAMLYRDIAKARRNVELLPDAILGLQRIVETGVYDEDMLVTSFLASEDFGHLPDEVGGFVHFYKGLDLARRGRDDWAEVHFEAIRGVEPVLGARAVRPRRPARRRRRLHGRHQGARGARERREHPGGPAPRGRAQPGADRVRRTALRGCARVLPAAPGARAGRPRHPPRDGVDRVLPRRLAQDARPHRGPRRARPRRVHLAGPLPARSARAPAALPVRRRARGRGASRAPLPERARRHRARRPARGHPRAREGRAAPRTIAAERASDEVARRGSGHREVDPLRSGAPSLPRRPLRSRAASRPNAARASSSGRTWAHSPKSSCGRTRACA